LTPAARKWLISGMLVVAALSPAAALARGGPGNGNNNQPPPPPQQQPPPPPQQPPPSTSSFRISPAGPFTGEVGQKVTYFFEAMGGQGTPFRFRIVSGAIPTGLSFVSSFGVQSSAATGTPTREGAFNFSLVAQDRSGHTTPAQAFTITIGGPRPLAITNGTDQLRPGTVGQSYQANIFADGGVPPWTWAVAGGTLPPGLRLSGNVISGTPTSAGTFSFTIRLSDSRGASTTQVFSITVS
jgi:hypothetical protein